MGPDQGQVGETHGLVPDCGGPNGGLPHQAAGLSRERQQTGTNKLRLRSDVFTGADLSIIGARFLTSLIRGPCHCRVSPEMGAD